MLSATLLFRSHAAYRAGCGTAMAGQAPETFTQLRSCLEYAGYALHIFKTPEVGLTWLSRHDDIKSLAAVRREFQAVKIEQVVASVDPSLGRIYSQLYQTAIDFGGHPNERGVTSNMQMKDADDVRHVMHLYLHGDGIQLQHALKLTAQTGLCSLHILQHIFAERFALIGLRDRLMQLQTSGL
jgi:hypothetical protein